MALDMDFSKLQPQDVLDLAIFAEEEAHEQYEHFAVVMDAQKNRDVADFFLKMAHREQLHRDQLAERREALYPGAQANLANRALWGVEASGELRTSKNVTARQAFEVAMEAERNAEAYYAAALQNVIRPEIAQLFESLRQSEVDHQRMLQLEMAKQPS